MVVGECRSHLLFEGYGYQPEKTKGAEVESWAQSAVNMDKMNFGDCCSKMRLIYWFRGRVSEGLLMGYVSKAVIGHRIK